MERAISFDSRFTWAGPAVNLPVIACRFWRAQVRVAAFSSVPGRAFRELYRIAKTERSNSFVPSQRNSTGERIIATIYQSDNIRAAAAYLGRNFRSFPGNLHRGPAATSSAQNCQCTCYPSVGVALTVRRGLLQTPQLKVGAGSWHPVCGRGGGPRVCFFSCKYVPIPCLGFQGHWVSASLESTSLKYIEMHLCEIHGRHKRSRIAHETQL